MFSSSYEYLQGFRQGNFLRFLEWPQFVAKHYATIKKEEKQDADDILAENLVNLLLFEWLNNGFCEKDVKELVVLYSVDAQEPSPLTGVLSNGLASIISAAFLCMVYHNNNLQPLCISKKPLNQKQIDVLINNLNSSLGEDLFVEYLTAEKSKFTQWVAEVSINEVLKASQKIASFTTRRLIISQYLLDLEANLNPKDELQDIRYTLLKKLAAYMDAQMEMTPEIDQKLKLEMKLLWEYRPAPFEEPHISFFSPLSSSDTFWRMMNYTALQLYSFVQPAPDCAQENIDQKEDILASSMNKK